MISITSSGSFEEAVLCVLKQRRWQLVHPDLDQAAWGAFVAQVAEYLSESEGSRSPYEKRLDRSVIGAYCIILYNACSEPGSQQQARAYEELWAWSYARIYPRVNNKQDVYDVAQEALLGIYRNHHKIDKPRGFLAWVNAIVRNQLRTYYRKNARLSRHESGMSDAADELDKMDDQVSEPSELPFDCEIRNAEVELLTMLDDCMTRRAERQKYVLIHLVFCEQSALQVAEKLKCTVHNVYLLFHRAKHNVLEHCPEVIARLLILLQPSERAQYVGGEV